MEGRHRPHCVDVALDDARIEHGTRVTVSHDAGQTEAVVGWLGGRFHQLRCDSPLRVVAGDRVRVGEAVGIVLDAQARKHGPSNDVLVRLSRILRELA